ncbi:hypothetical protein M501DRAFT_415810 [Patellaria atrata CBS 101060]|uniref:CP-type G domain-containing protein n=1 Tax=Patellaria atrata CBS 101060 TaxID=1346257 RepID=A0A9P4VUE6_9PEZI|nr:hypothetical protein M501DRAFT_415810 [Patellaria atrata CBS 101060]
MKVGKPKSKRVPVRLRHKIEKASAAKQRKQRKLAKQNPQWRSRLKKDPGIPNLFPYKDKILHEIEETRRLKEEEKERKKEDAKARRVSREEDEALEDYGSGEEDEAMEEDDANPMAALLASARARAAEYDNEKGEDAEMMDEEDEEEDEWDGIDEDGSVRKHSGLSKPRKDSSRKAFDKSFKQVVEQADVILYVLDARDPEGTRSREVERMVMAAEGGNKRLILILNKIDLIPPPALKGWLQHLKRSFPTLPLRASNPAPNARTFDHKQHTVKGTSENLLKALKAYSQSKQLKRSTSVGVIGYPNVGKSSVVNSLLSSLGGRTAACPTGAEAGITTSMREVKLDNKLKLLDSPGIVFPNAFDSSTSKKEEQARLILLNAIPPKEIDDPVPAVTMLLQRLSTSQDMLSGLLSVYNLPPLMITNGDVTTDFLVQVAKKRGRLGKGGVPNLHSAARTVLTDWRDGRIRGWVVPPTLQVATSNSAESTGSGDAPVGDQKEIVTQWAAEFKLDGLWGDGGDDAAEVMES